MAARDHSGEPGTGSGGTGSVVPVTGQVSAAIQSAVTPLLDFIGNKESQGYDDISGLVSQSRYPTKPLTQMTIQEVLDWQESIDRFQLSEASGRYQIMEDTLRGYNNDSSAGPGNPLYTRAGLSAGDLFSPINQDKMAIELLRGRGLDRYLNGSMTRETFANNLASEWASLPVVTGVNAGRSVYEGDRAGNRSLTTVQEFLAVLDEIKSRYDTSTTDMQIIGPQ
jgi:muramidase (phage lysozyme)